MVYIKGMDRCPIEITRGDTEVFEVGIVINGDEYSPQDGDVVRFVMKPDVLDTYKTRYIYAPVLEKEIPIDTMQLKFFPEDTKDLAFGKYVYDMQITFSDGTNKTFIKASPFVIAQEVD